ncbi:vanadium-dependent haloperoxidase [Flavitalea sp.]|nr:vanadium-dependent haloperoxidase [Flavitalea sp.]
MKKKTILTSILFSTLCLFYSCEKIEFPHPPKDPVSSKSTIALDWYKLQLRILLERNSAFNGIYFGYIGVALYEAVRYENKKSVSFSSKLYMMPAMPAIDKKQDYNWEVSANAALAAMVRSYYTGLTPANNFSIDSLEKLYNDKLMAKAGAATFARSQAYGKSIAKAVYDWSLTDLFNGSNAGYVPPVFTGAWVPTPPAFANGINPYLSAARTFLSANINADAATFPYAYSEFANSDYFKMVSEVYTVSQNLSTEQKNIALFWVDQGNGIAYTPPGHDMNIILQCIEVTDANLFTAAEALAKGGIGERDATIVCFKAKYKYNVTRPVTYIQKVIDPKWLPFIVTPPHPEYPAAHAFVSGGALRAAEHVLGKVKFTDHTYDFRGWTPRVYNSMFKAAEEAGISRLYGGIHYRISIETGLSLAEELGDRVGNLKMTD